MLRDRLLQAWGLLDPPPVPPPAGLHPMAIQAWAIACTARVLAQAAIAVAVAAWLSLDAACYWVMLAAALGIPTSALISRGRYPSTATLTPIARTQLALAVHVPAVISAVTLTLWTALHIKKP
jgi:uncharacterized membrane protein